jgi:arylsulfatase A-like enzyme
VVVLVVDTLRADKLRPFNPATRVKTPSVDRFASEGVVFELAQSPENWTKPAVASILTGLHPQTHQQKTGDAALPGSAVLLSEHLKDNGFATGSFIANGYVSDRFGFDQGWDDYSNYIREGGSTEAKDVFDAAGNWIEAHQEQRFFAYIQTIDPHVPYDPPGECDRA